MFLVNQGDDTCSIVNNCKVSRNANDDDLKKSYRRLAMKWHSDKNPLTKKAAEAKFKQISEAYDVLSDPQRRHAYDQHGGFDLFPKIVHEILKIEIKPGWKKGTKITFPEKGGNQEPGVTPADLTFVVDEKPHPVYTRDGIDLIVKKKVSLIEALTGVTLSLTTLDGRNLTIPVLDIVKPGQEIVIPNERMPTKEDPLKIGDLRVNLDVLFPSRLTSEQKNGLKRVLGGTLMELKNI
ncbi:BnaC05g07880D [Brassica napus]|uniref:BnaC05g07880D protein n=1 Tax=Brassica napus TaxID=3708 RepID=A0A078HJZ8_BRANA|nr:BnaC05g07880D [Brassica napus]